jgi:hypothetical protein
MTDDNLITELLDALHRIPIRMGRFFNEVGAVADDSPAGRDQKVVGADSSKVEMLNYLRQRALDALRYCSDAVDATARLLQPPPKMFAPGPVIRSGLENAGLVCWLSELGVSADGKVQRGIAIGKQDWNEEVGLARAGVSSANPGDEVMHQAILDWAIQERDSFVQKTAKIQLSAISVPKDSDIVALCDAGYEYRLNTGLAHGNPTVHRAVESMFRGQASTPDSTGVIFFNYLTTVADAYCRATWSFGSYVLAPANLEKLRSLLHEIYDSIQMSDEVRDYFRSGSGGTT